MDTEKINIFVPTKTAELLERDARAFEIYKANKNEVNMNRFLSQLIVGYYDTYIETYQRMRDKIASILEVSTQLDALHRSSTADLMIKKVFFPETPKQKGKHAKRLSLKPTVSTRAILINIESQLNGDSLSQFLCRMFTSYAQNPPNDRERIIFKSTYEFILRACKNRHPFSFLTVWNDENVHEILPYSIETSKEELYNYLLCQEYNPHTDKYEARSYRLNRITHEQLSIKVIPIDEDVQHHIEMMKEYGPQYPINEDEESCVRLTENGAILFNRIYFGRPTVDRIEQNADGTYYYYFRGSTFQLYTYFRRFDKDHAVILSPESLRIKMIEAYRSALDAYST